MRGAFGVLALCLLAVPHVAAAREPPADLEADYEGATDTLTLTWEQGGDAPDSWRIYEGAEHIDTAYTTSWSIDLSGWTGVTTYSVRAQWGEDLSLPTNAVYVARQPPFQPCPVVIVVVTYPPPGAEPVFHPECMP